jgi:hypothetical protein
VINRSFDLFYVCFKGCEGYLSALNKSIMLTGIFIRSYGEKTGYACKSVEIREDLQLLVKKSWQLSVGSLQLKTRNYK